MTNAAPDDSVDPTTHQQTRPDELEDWLTDLRVTLTDDPPDWLTPEDDTVDPVAGSLAPPPTEDHPLPDAGTPVHSALSDGNQKGDPPAPAVGRHRAAE